MEINNLIDSARSISFTKTSLPFGWLGNMAPFPILYLEKEWRTTEALFQALRFDDESIRELIRAEKSPMGAKFKAKSLVSEMVVEQLSKEDTANMLLCVRLKIAQHEYLKKDLLDTGELSIYEDVTKRGDKGSNLFWGAMLVNGEWVGKNTLGKIWMDVRKELSDEKNAKTKK